MKTMKKVLVSLMMLLFTATLSISPLQTKAQGWVSVQYFYDHLSPHGNWVYYPDYGNVWVPYVHSGFRPYYTNGRWAYTNYGWMWVSSYRWGWATFHYGSWTYDPWYGWMWIPGYRWAPAWVTWGYYGGYYGWAPVGPGFVYGNPYYPPMNYWTFVHPNHMASQDWQNNHYVPSDNQIVINNVPVNQVENITLINNSGSYSGQNYHAGPTKESFEKVTKQPLQVVSVKENAAPGKDGMSGNEIAVYRPKVNETDKGSAKPAKVVPLESIKRTEGTKPVTDDKANRGTPGSAGTTTQKPGSSTSGTPASRNTGNAVTPGAVKRDNTVQPAKQNTSTGKGSDSRSTTQPRGSSGQDKQKVAPSRSTQPSGRQPAGTSPRETKPGSSKPSNTGRK